MKEKAICSANQPCAIAKNPRAAKYTSKYKLELCTKAIFDKRPRNLFPGFQQGFRHTGAFVALSVSGKNLFIHTASFRR